MFYVLSINGNQNLIKEKHTKSNWVLSLFSFKGLKMMKEWWVYEIGRDGKRWSRGVGGGVVRACQCSGRRKGCSVVEVAEWFG